MPAQDMFQADSEAVRTHIEITQSVIKRMASNSASCKTWCITLVSATLLVVADKSQPNYALLAFIPTSLFLALDTYYLALERMFRQSYDQFLSKLHQRNVALSDLYVIAPRGNMLKTFGTSLLSVSILPFYITLLVMIVIAEKVFM